MYKFSPTVEFSAGINGKYGEYRHQETADPDIVYYYLYDGIDDIDAGIDSLSQIYETLINDFKMDTIAEF